MKLSAGFRGILLAALAAGLHAEEKPAGESAKSAHWLVDAMAEQSADSHEDPRSGASPADGRSTANASRAYAKPDDGAANPLSSYLTTWMTPRDIEILKIKGPDTNTPGVATFTGQDRMAPRGPAANVRTNPYLADPAPGVAAILKAPQNVPAAPVPLAAPPPGKKDAAPAKTPGPPADLLKSQDDAKYFPQLKRF